MSIMTEINKSSLNKKIVIIYRIIFLINLLFIIINIVNYVYTDFVFINSNLSV
jgi:hypothetical protein